MADYITTAGELASIANAIRLKFGETTALEYPSEWIELIENGTLNSGGAEISPLDSLIELRVTDTELIAIADAIRSRNKVSERLEYPDDFILAINAIQPDLQKIAYLDATSTSPYTTVGNSGASLYVGQYPESDPPYAEIRRGGSWIGNNALRFTTFIPPEAKTLIFNVHHVTISKSASWSQLVLCLSDTANAVNQTAEQTSGKRLATITFVNVNSTSEQINSQARAIKINNVNGDLPAQEVWIDVSDINVPFTINFQEYNTDLSLREIYYMI